MNALRGGYPGDHGRGSNNPKFDKLGGRELAGPDDLYKTDKKGRKGSLTKSRMDVMKANSPYRVTGPKGPLPENFDAEYDDEAGMADNNLETLKRAVQGLDNLIGEGDNLPEWCQEKIAVAKSMLVAVWDYMASEEDSVAEGYDPVESDYKQWEDILIKDGGNGGRGNASGDYALELVAGPQSSDSDWISTIRNILTYVKQNRAVLGKEVSDETGKTVKDAIIDIKREYPQLYQAAQQPQGVAEGKEDKIAQLKKDHDTAVHWSKNETNPHKREAARQKAEKIKGHLEKQYKQSMAKK
jgi:hypothetical protein